MEWEGKVLEKRREGRK
ncbi:hypothetical protein CAEBREN_08085 [Caenorhabditis brenneri]|uniref:Uncharacterized protein n=1 Tax=Caenorhabditis brenneri TaxID=135651 RepID=G0P633_CAEBE|nr:hypothetical protein CAEBREN_08085 [Caenorhabditis brenneri]